VHVPGGSSGAGGWVRGRLLSVGETSPVIPPPGCTDVDASCQAAVAVSTGGLGVSALAPLANILLASATILSALVRPADLHDAGRVARRRTGRVPGVLVRACVGGGHLALQLGDRRLQCRHPIGEERDLAFQETDVGLDNRREGGW